MAHKTHKTAHVLNLLSVGTGNEEKAEQAENREAASNIQIMDNLSGSEDPLAGLIKDSLAREMLDELESGEEGSLDTDENIAPDDQMDEEEDRADSLTDDSITPQEPLKAVLPPIQEPEPAQPVPPVPEADYRYVNIMDVLIDRRLEEFMKKFDTCTCERCQMDVRALAMSNLPPKYIVMPNTSYAPLISFYANKYQFNIITELTKACLAIIGNPRHKT